MVAEKRKRRTSQGKPTLYTSAINTLSLGVLLVVYEGKKEKIRFASRHLDETLGISSAELIGKEASVFWDLLIGRLGNPYPFREDLERISQNQQEIRTDILHLVQPAALVVERSTAPMLDAGGKFLGRIWTFRNVSREFKLREELQKKRKTEFCFRVLSSFLFESSLSSESLEEICRIACMGLDVASVCFVPVGMSDEVDLAQFSVSRRYRFQDEPSELRLFARRAAKNLESTAVSVLMVDELSTLEQKLFTDRHIARLLLVPVGSGEARSGVLLIEEIGRDRHWLREDFRCVQSVASALSLWLEKEEHEANLVRAREEAEAVAKVRSDFIALISHELRTPLSPLIGFTQLLEEQSEGMTEEARDMVSRIGEGALRLRELIEDLLTLTRLDSRLDGWRKYPCDPRGILEDCCAWVTRLAEEKTVSVQLELEAGLGIVEADGAAVRRAMNALLSNAVRFSPEGGVVRVVATTVAEGLLVKIVDQGPGVADEAKAKIFEPFVQGEPVLTRRFGGAGIGLTLVRRVADAHQGRVWVEDGTDGGSVFFLQLPTTTVEEE